MKYDAISYLNDRLAYLTNPVNLSAYLYDMEDFYNNKRCEQAFYPCKQAYISMCAQNWKDEIEQVTAKLNHLTQ
jgi:hypothetical protein